MGRVTDNALRKFTPKSKRRRTSNMTKVKYQKPTRDNQRDQIMSNAVAIKRLYKIAMPK